MKNLILLILFIFGANSLTAQEQRNISNKNKTTKVKPSEKNSNYSSLNIAPSKAKEKEIVGIDPLSGSNTKAEDKGLEVPDYMKNPSTKAEERGIYAPDEPFNTNSKTRVVKTPTKLSLKNITYEVKRSENGFNLYENGATNAYAKLERSEKEGYYIYLSPDNNGTAHFDNEGNLIVEYLNTKTGKKKEIYFQTN